MSGSHSFQGSWRATAAIWMVPVLLALGGGAVLSSRIHDLQYRAGAIDSRGGARGIGLLAEISKRPEFAFGFQNVFGDLAWLSAVQIAGNRHMLPEDHDRLYRNLVTVANFDPRFVVPYILGGMILGDSPQHVDKALEILARGMKAHPGDWRFPFYIGYTRYFSLGDSLEGAKAIETASRIPGSPPYLTLLAARMYSEGRAPETALALLERMVRQETDTARLEILYRRTREVIVERDLQALEKAVAAHREQTGAVPGGLADLVRSGWIREIPEEPNGGSYILSSDGTVRSDRVNTRLKVFRTQ